MQKITSNQNPRFKNAIKLHTARGRKQQGRIIIFGFRETSRALNAGVDITEVFCCADLVSDELMGELNSLLADTNVIGLELSQLLFEKLMYGSRSDGVIAIANRPNVSLDRFPLETNGIVLVVQSLENPGNLGAIARSVDGAGASGLIVVDSLTDVFHPNAIRTSMGTLFSIPLAVTTSKDLQGWLTKHQITTFVACPDAKVDIFEVDLTGPCAVVFGNEAQGLNEAWLSPEFVSVRLPMNGLADSLNVAVSASVVAYEALRQRR